MSESIAIDTTDLKNVTHSEWSATLVKAYYITASLHEVVPMALR